MSLITQLIDARHAQTAQAIADTITANPDQHTPELVTELEHTWPTYPSQRDERDAMWLAALIRLPAEVREAAYQHAYTGGHYAAARCIAYHRAPARDFAEEGQS